MEKRLQDLIPFRRDVLKWGGLALAGAWVDRVVWPLKVSAAGKAKPRSTARHCIMIELAGAPHQAYTFDFKETKYLPKDFEPQKLNADLTMSKTLFPRLIGHMDKVALTRTAKAAESIHFTGQYHTQTGRGLNLGLAREIPAFGSVVAYELESRRRPSDAFPSYVSTGLTQATAGSIGCGFLPTRFTGLDLDPLTVFETLAGNNEGIKHLLDERWRALEMFTKVSEAERNSLGKNAQDYKSYYDDARRLGSDPKWLNVFQTSAEEKKRYGENKLGMGCIIAKNLVAADSGTHFVYVYDGASSWDHHANMFAHDKKGLYTSSLTFDNAMSSLLEDLSKMPGSVPGKTLLDETLVLAAPEFGRTFDLNPAKGTDHYGGVFTQFWAGGGVKGGRIIGKTDEMALKAVDTGWNHKEQYWTDNAVASVYSALGIDWLKSITNTPSRRAYEYVQSAPLGPGGEFNSADEIGVLFG
jgi:Protein of unknown function (DUF1501)